MFKLAAISTATLALASALAAAAAVQSPRGGEVTVLDRPRADVEIKGKVVDYRRLNIETPEGVQTLLGGIRRAAEEVCSPAPDRNLRDSRDYERCKSEAIDAALAQVNSPAVSALYGRSR
jgi:UrcA family protein